MPGRLFAAIAIAIALMLLAAPRLQADDRSPIRPGVAEQFDPARHPPLAPASGAQLAQTPQPLPIVPGPPPSPPTPTAPAAAFYAIEPADQALLSELGGRLEGLLSRLESRWGTFRAEFTPDRATLIVETALQGAGLALSGPAHPGVMPLPSLDGPTRPAPNADYVASARDETAGLWQSMSGAYGSWRSQISAYAENLGFRARALMLTLGHSAPVAERLRARRPVALHPDVRAQLVAEVAMLEAQFVPFAAHLEPVEAELMHVYAEHWARLADLSQRGARVWASIRALHAGLAPSYQALDPSDPGRVVIQEQFDARLGPLANRLNSLYFCMLGIQQSALLPMRMLAGYPGLNMRFLAPSVPNAFVPEIPQRLTDVLPVPVAITSCHSEALVAEIAEERPGFAIAQSQPGSSRLATVVDEPGAGQRDPQGGTSGATPPTPSQDPPGIATVPPTGDDPPGIATVPPTGDGPPGIATVPPTRDDPPGIVTIPPTGDDPPGIATVPPTGDGPPGIATVPRTQDDPPGIVAVPPTQDDPPGIPPGIGTVPPTRGDPPPGIATVPRTRDDPPGIVTVPPTQGDPPVVVEDPPVIPEGPPTHEELPTRVLACRLNADGVIAYPRLTDALRPAQREASRHEPPIAGDGVALQDGSFTHQAQDLDMAGPGMPLQIIRSYRSTVAYERGGLLGQGWSLNLDRRILPQPVRNDDGRLLGMEDLGQPQPVLFQDGSGRSDRHEPITAAPGTGWRMVINWGRAFRAHVTTYISPPGAFWEIQRYLVVDSSDHPFGRHRNIDAAGGESLFYVLRDKDGAQQVFNCRGQLVLVLDRHDNRITLEYSGDPNPLTQNPILVRAQDTAGRAYEFASVEIGRAAVATHWFGQPLRLPDAPILRLAGFTDFAGRAIRYGFAGGEDEPRLAEVIGEPGRGGRYVTRYGYDGAGRLATLTAPRQSAQDGRPWLAMTYDGAGRVVVQEQAGAASRFDWSGGEAAEQLPDGTVRNYGLVDTGAGWATDRIEVLDPADNGSPWVSSFAYNRFAQLSEVVLPLGNRTRYIHEAANAPVTAGPVRNDGGVTYLNNLAAGNLLAIEREPAGGGAERLVQTWRYEPLYNEIAEETDANGNSVLRNRFEYHGYGPERGRNGNPVAIEIPRPSRPDAAAGSDSLQVRFEYDTRGLKVLEIDQIGGRSHYDYDRFGYPAALLRPDGSEIRMTHDSRGNMTERRGPGRRHVRFEHDLRDLLTRRIDDPNGAANTVRFAYDENRNLTRIETDWKDNFGRESGAPEVQGSRRVAVEHAYDLANRRIQTRELLDGEELRSTSMRYDLRGRLVQKIAPSPSGSGTTTTSHRHDARGLLLSETLAAGTASARTRRYQYDANGNLVAEWGPDGTMARQRQYDRFDRLESVTDALGTVTRFSRDRNGNPVEIAVDGATGRDDRTAVLSRVNRRYDELNRAIEQTYWANPDAGTGPARERWFYDERGLLQAQERPDGSTVRYAHDALGRPVLATQPNGNVTRNAYDGSGDLATVEEEVRERMPGPSGVGERRTYTTVFEHDALGRITGVDSDGQTSRRWYDSMNRLRGNSAAGGFEARYDGLGRRIFVRNGQTVLRFDYNAAGLATAVRPNRGPSELTEYDDLGQIRTLTVERRSGDRIEQRLVHDAAGRLIEVREPGGIVQRMRHDAIGQTLEQSYQSGADTVLIRRFGYDGLGRVVSGESGLTAFARVHDGLGNLVSEEQSFRGDSHTVTARYAEDLSQRVLVYPEVGGKPLSATWHYDEMGRVVRLGADGRNVAEYAYVGADRVQRRALANGVTGYRVYGPNRALTGIEVWHQGRERWIAKADAAGGHVTAWPNDPGARGAMASQSLTIRANGEGRIDETETRMVLPPASSADLELPFIGYSFHDYDSRGRLATINNVGLDGRAAPTQASQNRFAYDDRDRVIRVETRMAERSRIAATEPSAGADALGALARRGVLTTGWSHQEVQEFSYDERDRLIRDGRFDYAFDPDGRLVRIADRWASRLRLPLREIDLHYDAIGRLVAIENQPTGSTDSLRLLHDGEQVIAELAYSIEQGRYAGRGFLAYYLHGARPGEIVRMDRRRSDVLDAAFDTWYPQEDLDGRIAFLTSPTGEFREVTMQDHPWLTRVPRIEGTATTMPYLGNRSRHLFHPDAPLNEAAGTLSYNFRATPELRFRKEIDRFNRRVYDQAWDLQAAGTIVMSAPLLPVYSSPLAAQAYLSLGLNWSLSGLTGRDYSPTRALLDFGLGGIGGYFSSAAIARLPLSAAGAVGLDLAADASLNALVDVIAEGDDVMSALTRNAIGIAAGRTALRGVRNFIRTPMPNQPMRRIVEGPPPARASTDASVPARRPTMVLEESPVPGQRIEEGFNQAAYDNLTRRLRTGELADPDGFVLFKGLVSELETLARGSDAYIGRWARRALRNINDGKLKFRPFDDNLRLEYPVGGNRVNNGIAFGPIGWSAGGTMNGAYNPNTNLIRLNPLVNGSHRATPRDLVATFLHEFAHSKGANEFEAWYIELRTLYRTNPQGNPNLWLARRFGEVLLEEGRVPARWGPRLQYFIADYQGYRSIPHGGPWLWDSVFKTGTSPF